MVEDLGHDSCSHKSLCSSLECLESRITRSVSLSVSIVLPFPEITSSTTHDRPNRVPMDDTETTPLSRRYLFQEPRPLRHRHTQTPF